MAQIELRRVTKRFSGVTALHEASFTIDDGELFILVGPSGCGKSTLLNLIVGLDEVSDGEIRVDGQVVNDIDPKDRDMAMVFQSYAIYPHMTVRENMAFPLKLAKFPKEEIRARVAKAAEVLELTEVLDRRPRALSGGQRQRVAMGRAIVREPKVFLLDEPLSNLDAKLRVQMRTEILRLQRRLGTTMVYVTHDQTEAMTLGHRIAVLRKGRVLADRHAARALRATRPSLRRGLHRITADEFPSRPNREGPTDASHRFDPALPAGGSASRVGARAADRWLSS